ncbi:MAG: FixG Ig-like domain-containing protein, partial [Devosia sp.]
KVSPERVRDRLTGRLVDAITHTNWRSIVRPRTIIYLIGWSAIGLAMLTVLSLRTPISISVLHDRNPLFVTLKDGTIQNGFDVKILNMTPAPRQVHLTLDGIDGVRMALAERPDEASAITLDLEPDAVMPLRVYVEVDPAELTAARTPLTMTITTADGNVRASAVTQFEAPEPSR